MISFWSTVSYTTVAKHYRLLSWHEVDTGYYSKPPISLYVNFTSTIGTVIATEMSSKKFAVSGLLSHMYYDVCVVPMSFGGITHSFCGTKNGIIFYLFDFIYAYKWACL